MKLETSVCPTRPFARPDAVERSAGAFNRLELCVCLGCIALLTMLVLPALAGNKAHGDRAVCANNLRQIGHALLVWASDHGDNTPWVTEYSEGGMLHPPADSPLIALRNNPYIYYNWTSNELVTPQVLVCPADAAKKPAQDFSNLPGRGLNNPAFKNNAVSYFIGMHAAPELPESVLHGDRNISYSGVQPCGLGPLGAAAISFRQGQSQWLNTPIIHGLSGNFLLYDGRVEPLSNVGLIRFFSISTYDADPPEHWLIPN